MPIKGINLCEHVEGCQTTVLLLKSARAPGFFEREKSRKPGILSLAFPGNPRIKEESRVPDQRQKVKAFLHLRKSLESVENCLLAFRDFPGIPGKPGEHGHS